MPLPPNESRRGSPPQVAGDRAPRLVLASASPRRSRLLTEAGFEHMVVPPPLDDGALEPGGRSPRRWVVGLAYLKADATRRSIGADRARTAVVLGADTTVVKGGRIIGQPADEDDARTMLAELRGGSHEVVTGVALLTSDRPRIVFVDAARVRVGAIPDAAIDAYVATGAWRGKAGGYNLEERLREGWPIEYEGDPGTIMGLPMRRLAPMLLEALAHAAPMEARA